MKLRLKLNPALRRPELPPGDRRRWLLGVIALRREQRAVPVWTFEIFWRRLALGAAGAAVAVYLLAVTALWLWLDRAPHNQVTWGALAAAPVRWENFRQARGDRAIARGLERLRARDYVEAYYHLRIGLARSPGNVRGRLTLASLTVGSDPAQALVLLEEGLRHSADDPELLRALFAGYAQQLAAERALEKSRELLEREPPLPAPARRAVALARAELLTEAGDAAGALGLLAGLTGDSPRERARVAQARLAALLRLGRLDEAREVVAEFERAGAAGQELHRAQAELAIAAGDTAALEGALRRVKADAGDQPQGLVYAFTAWHRMKRLTLRDAVEQDFYRTFGANDAALQLLAATAMASGAGEVVHRAQQVAARHRLSPFAFRVHLTELALRRGDFDAAFRQLREWERQVETLPPAQRAYPEFLVRLARTAIGGEQQSAALHSHLAALRGRATAGMYRLALETLERAGQADGARQVAQLGLRVYPHTVLFRAAEARLAALAASAVRPAGAAEKPDPLVMPLPPSGPAALQRLDELLAEGSFTAARALLRALRTAPPPWAANFEADLASRETQLALLTQDGLTARAVLRAHLDRYRDDEAALRLIGFAAALVEQQRLAEARLVHDEVATARPGRAAVAAALRSLNLPDDLADAAAALPGFVAAVDRALEQNQPAEALRVLEHVKQKPPAWLEEARTEVTLHEVRVRLALDQRPLALGAWKDLVLRRGAPRAAAFKFVRETLANGAQERAQLLAREIVRLLPDDPAAIRLLRETEAPLPTDE
jgi:hypothetical protein